MKRILSWILVFALLAGVVPMPVSNAMYTWITQREYVKGSDFTQSAAMAEKLDSIFDGNLNIYHDVKCTDPMTVPFGCSDLKNNNVYKYIGPEGGPAICSGTSCWVYANAVYYTLFGESTFSGVAMANSVKLNTPYYPAATYENFVAWGVRPAVGALVRAQGHSMIVLGYDAETLTILDANGDGNGLVSIRIRTWDEVSFFVEYIIQPKAEFYSEAYPGWEAPDIACAYPASCALEVTEEAVAVRSQPGGDTLALEQAVEGVRYRAVGLVEIGEGELWYQVRSVAGPVGYLPVEAVDYLGEVDDVTASGVTAPAHHPVGQKYVLAGSVTSESSELNAVSVFVYQETEEGKTLVAGEETPVTGHYYNLYKSPMDQSNIFSKLPEGTYTYEVAATYTRCQVDAEGKVVTQTATRTLYAASFQMTDGIVICSHEYSTDVTREPACGAGGSQTVTCKLCATGYTQLMPAAGEHTYASQVAIEATCTQEGVRLHNCTGCFAGYFEAIPATGHSYGDWQTVTEVGCTTNGTEKQVCTTCGFAQSRELAAIGHSYTGRTVEANCSDYEKQLYTCENCADSYSVYPEEYTQWSEEKPEGIEESRLETKTQYRYSDCETVESYEAELPGGILLGNSWQEATEESVQYAKAWPSGFSTDHDLYAAYNNAPQTDGETETQVVQVQSETLTGYLYYHWCEGTYAHGPINRGAKATSYGKYTSFHAFYSTTNPSSLVAASDASYTYCNSACCKDSYWYFAVPVYTQTYVISRNLFTYELWSDWSDWSDTEYMAADDRKVEERVLYRYSTRVLGDHAFDESKITAEPTCQAEGVRTFYCSYCDATQTQSVETVDHSYQKGSCIWCDARDPDYLAFTAQPQAETVKLGNRAAFTVEVEGEVKSYQWQYQMVEGGPWWNCTQYTKGYNTPTLNVIAAEKRQGFLYRCRVTDTDGNKHYSDTAELTVDIPENYAVLSQPQNTWVMPGSTTTFHVDTQGEGLTYQWEYHKGVDKTGPQYYWIAMGTTTGCKTDTLTIAGISGSINRDGWAYRCVITDPNGYIYTTDHAFLQVASAQITSQPESQTAALGSKAVFSVEAEGEVAAYRWQYSTDGGKSWYNSSSATPGYNTATLTVGATANRNGFLYRCKLTDSQGNVLITSSAQLTVQ